MNKLDESWKEKADKIADLDISRSDLYYGGASDFQKRIIEKLENLRDIKNLDEDTLDLILITIENLKAE